MVFGRGSKSIEQLNQIYTKTANKPLAEFSSSGVTGLKMRFITPGKHSVFRDSLPKDFTETSFRHMMFNVLKKNDVVVFLALRQDILKWALSKYHGDGTGRPGHLQFKLANGKIKRSAIGKIHVDGTRLETIISQCLEAHARKRRLIEDFNLAGIQTHSLIYEDFLTDKQEYLARIFDIIELNPSTEEIDAALKKGTYFEKVHSDDISKFVVNHEEVEEKFGQYHSGLENQFTI
jgi:hypothetical protein